MHGVVPAAGWDFQNIGCACHNRSRGWNGRGYKGTKLGLWQADPNGDVDWGRSREKLDIGAGRFNGVCIGKGVADLDP